MKTAYAAITLFCANSFEVLWGGKALMEAKNKLQPGTVVKEEMWQAEMEVDAEYAMWFVRNQVLECSDSFVTFWR